MVEVAVDGGRGRGEYPRRARSLAVRAQRPGHVQRRALPAAAARRQFVPAHIVVRPAAAGIVQFAPEVALDLPARDPRQLVLRTHVAGPEDRKSDGWGNGESVSVILGGARA